MITGEVARGTAGGRPAGGCPATEAQARGVRGRGDSQHTGNTATIRKQCAGFVRLASKRHSAVGGCKSLPLSWILPTVSWLAHRSQLARLAAVLVALALSGLPRVVALAAPEEAHRCSCRAHGDHDCTCAKCAAIAARRRAAEAAPPPCHAPPPGVAAPEPHTPPGPCITGSCGAPEEPRPAVNGVDLFTLPIDAPRTVPPPVAALPGALPGPQHQPQPPEPPPPRADGACARADLAAGAQAR